MCSRLPDLSQRNTACQEKVPQMAQISFGPYGPYSAFTTRATLGSHPDYTLPGALHVCPKRPTFALGHLLFDKWATVGSYTFYILSRPNEAHICLPLLFFFFLQIKCLVVTIYLVAGCSGSRLNSLSFFFQRNL